MIRLREDGLLVLALAAAALFSFVELVPSGLRAEAVAPFLQLSAGALVLAIAGWSVSTLCAIRVADGNFALQIGIGQIALLAWIYLRSSASALATSVAHTALPVTRPEIFLLIAGMAWLAYKRSGLPRVASAVPGALWVIVAIFLIAQRELPRLDMISSDPLQHAFFTSQVLRLGGVPFHLGMWGPEDFHYPAGFAALCALWTWVGGVSALDSVAGQPLVQSTLAVLALGGLAAGAVAPRDRRLLAVVGFIGLLLFFGFFPYSLTHPVYLLEKTGNISTLLLLLTTLTLSYVGGAGKPSHTSMPALLLAAAGVGLLAVVNPIAIIVPGLILTGAVCKRLWELRPEPARAAGLMLALAALPVALIFSDPYYIGRFLAPAAPAATAAAGETATPATRNASAASATPVTAAAAASTTAPAPASSASAPDAAASASLPVTAAPYALELLRTLQWTKPFLQTPYFGRTPVSILPLLLGFGLAWWLLPAPRRRPVLGVLVLAPIPIVALEFALLPVFHALRFRGDLYLLEPYLFESLVRYGYLWYMAVLLLALALLCQRARRLPAGLALCAVAAAALMVPVRMARDGLTNEVRMKPRHDRCFYIGCTTADDRVVLQELTRLYAAYVAGGGRLDFASVPKVLLPNVDAPVIALWQQYADGFIERWYKPAGAASVVPFASTYPAAFFYYKGTSEYSNENYQNHVCLKLDLPWLRERNIRYLFVPANRQKTCVAGLDTLLKEGKVIARSGGAALIELF